MGLCNTLMVEKITELGLGPFIGVPVGCTHFSTLLSSASDRSEVIFGNAIVLLICSASSEWAPCIERFSFEKLQDVGSGK